MAGCRLKALDDGRYEYSPKKGTVSFDDLCARMLKLVPPEVWKGLPNGRQVAKVDTLIALSAKRHNVSLFATNDDGQLKICKSIGLNATLCADLAKQGSLLLGSQPK
ncbi:MAG: hypothetical protein Q8K32_32345 [Archangium sp.]|nr:hypothetical protein [Archangium sp.]